jgi:hypothetical protein
MVRDHTARGGAESARTWALGQFGTVELGDRRLSKDS